MDFGNLPINRMISRKVPVINDGLAAIELKFDLMKDLPSFQTFRERIQACPTTIHDKLKTTQKHSSASETKQLEADDIALQTAETDLSKILEIEPIESIVLQPGKIVNVLVKYKPKRRMSSFVTKVACQTDSTILPLFIVRGSCIGAEFSLNRTYLPFGTVVQGCSSEMKLMLSNTGDIGARLILLINNNRIEDG